MTPDVKRTSGAEFFNGVAISGIAFALIGLVNYAIRRVLAVNLNVEDYGFFYSALTLSTTAVVLLDIGIGESQTILTARAKSAGNPGQARSVFYASVMHKVVCGAVIVLLLYMIHDLLLHRFFRYADGAAPFLLLAISIPIAAIFRSMLNALRGVKDFVSLNATQALVFLMVLTINISLIDDLGVLTPAAAWLAAHMIIVPVGWLYLRSRHRDLVLPAGWSRSSLRDLWAFSGWITIAQAGTMIITSVDTLMLTQLANLREVALYNVALPIMQIFLFLMILPMVFCPIACELWEDKKHNELNQIYQLTFDLILFFGFLMLLFTLCYAESLISVMFNTEFTAAATALKILGLSVPLQVIAALNITILNAVGATKPAAKIVAAAVCVNIAGNAVLIRLYGIDGAALATLATYVLIFAGTWGVIRSTLRVHAFRWSTIALIVSGVLGSMYLYAATSVSRRDSGWQVFGAVVAIYCLVSGVAMQAAVRRGITCIKCAIVSRRGSQ